MRVLARTVFLTALGCLMTAAGVAQAAPIVGLYYVADEQLRRVDFDGTSFTSAATILENLDPTWSGFSYDPNAGVIYYVADSHLRRVDFDGSNFTSIATELVTLDPTWSAMSYDVDANIMYYVADSQLRRVDFDGSTFTSIATVLEDLDPNWTGMSLIFGNDEDDNTTVPEPGMIGLLGIGYAGLTLLRRRRSL